MTFALPTVQSATKDGQRRHLMECLEAQIANFIPLAEAFYAKGRRSENDYRDLCDAVIHAAWQVLCAENWEASLFLRNTLKPIKRIYEGALVLREKLGVRSEQPFVAPVTDENKRKLYISLYQSNGHDLKGWALQLASLSQHLTGRPIYEDEFDVAQAIRLKLSQLSEAYVVVAVDHHKIVPAETPRKDRWGKPLVSLLPNAVESASIIEFIHHGKRYYYLNETRGLLEQTA